ncbi:hypothetical protein PVK06_008028 [Gossypium arboreum]|uniref:RNase H type-1 domain-containing protein n=1 Tax=Gossypium arboreum TaxID=29729 RepID=A0ABR0QJU9_GOSAR|nr:hypothetical protein PVK06_008028 [Gossypium arboreum]
MMTDRYGEVKHLAVQMGLNLGFMEVMIEGDALAIVKKLHANHDDRSVISAYTIDSKSLSANYNRCVFVHTSRKENGLTHLLDSEGICKGETTYMVEGVPPFATSEVEKDMWWTDPSD